MGAVDQFLADLLHKHMAAPRLLSCSDWADQYRIIAKGPERGQWRTERTPYLREPMNCTDPESPFQRVVMMFATQLGKSEVLYNAVLKRIHISPMDMMMVQPTLQDAKDHSSQRFTQTARVMPYVLSNIAETRSRDETNTLLTKELANGSATLFFSGANSARSLASKPLGFAACDEVDGYPNDVDGEGDPVGLIEERMSNFPNRKLLMCSTPTTRDASRIETEYLASDRRRYHLPCPHCGGLQHLEWGNDTDHGIKWLKTDAGIARPETAVYICKHCGAAIQEHHKTEMLENGVWIPENPGAGRGLVAGFHMNKLYSPLGWKSWPMLVDQWLKAREKSKAGDHSLLKTFINTSLAQTWEEDGDKIDQHYLSRRAEDYRLRMVPFGCYFLTAGVDVQGDRLEVRVKGYGRGEESWTIDRHIIYGDPAIGTDQHGSPWAALDEYLSQPISHESGSALPIQSVAIDSGGHHTQQVYNYTRTRSHRNVFAVKGQSQRGKPIIGKPSDININKRGEKIKGQKLWLVGTDTAKALIYGRMRMIEVGPGYCHYSKDLPPDEFEQLTAERLVTRYIKGHAVMEFVKPAGRRNEALDCEVYALAAAYQLGMNRWKDADWDRHQRQAEPERKPDAVQQQKIAQPSTGKIGFSQLVGRFK